MKVVCDTFGRALYFSRAPIPWNRDGAAGGLASQQDFERGATPRRHLCLPRKGAAEARAAAPGALELREKLEQLRALENGMTIRVAVAAERPGQDVNTPEDLEKVAVLLEPP